MKQSCKYILPIFFSQRGEFFKKKETWSTHISEWHRVCYGNLQMSIW